jgi:RHS repeat-associated protein
LANANVEYAYNANGAMTKDLNKGITNISYNLLNLPQQVDVKSPIAEARNTYSYSAGGAKLRVVQRYNSNYNTSPVIGSTVNTSSLDITKTTDYAASKVFENSTLKRILVDGGYIENGTYYFYEMDHLGDNRVVVSQSGSSIQNTDYYPFGKPMAHSTSAGAQPYKFGGKEYDTMHGLNWSDFSARMLDMDIPVFPTADPLSEKYYSISPYAYCAGNPVNAMDLNGDSITTTINATINNTDGTTRVQTDKYHYGKDSNGNYGFLDGSGNLYSGDNAYVKSLTTALNDLRTGGSVGNALVSDLANSTKNVRIAQGTNTADPNGTYIRWNPNSTTGGMNQIGTENRPAYIGLGHEMAHIQDSWRGTIDNKPWITVGATTIQNAEKYATHIENQLRAENGIPLRTHYGIDVSTGTRVALESTRIISGSGISLFYSRSNGIAPNGIPLLSTAFLYRRR